MSKAVSALQGKAYSGLVEVEEMGLRGMITLRGDLASTKVKAAVKAAVTTDVPEQNTCLMGADTATAWMSPDELLLLCPYQDVASVMESLNERLAGTHFLAANVSDARAVFQLRGDAVRDVMAKVAPVNLAQEAFPTGHFRRTRLAQTPVAFFFSDDQTLELVCFRSVAEYVFSVLTRAAAPGSEVGFL